MKPKKPTRWWTPITTELRAIALNIMNPSTAKITIVRDSFGNVSVSISGKGKYVLDALTAALMEDMDFNRAVRMGADTAFDLLQSNTAVAKMLHETLDNHPNTNPQ